MNSTTTKKKKKAKTRGSKASPTDLRTSLGGVACKWAEKNLVHGEGDLHGKPYRLLPWQRETLWRWYERDPAGGWWYEDALIGAERGAVKTELLAAMAMIDFAGPAVFRRPTPLVHAAAAALKQAGELFRQCQIMAGGSKGQEVRTAPLGGLFDVFDTEIQYRSGAPGRIERVAADAGTIEGGKTTLFLADELHEWTGPKARVYTVLSAATTKSLTPGRVAAISTAGVGRFGIPAKDTDPILWQLYARGIARGSDPSSRFLFLWREAGDRWNLDKPAELRSALAEMVTPEVTWSIEARARKAISEGGVMARHEFERYFLNRFVDVVSGTWLEEKANAWGELEDPNAAPPDGSDVVVGVDMALHHDSVAVVVAGRLDDGRVGWWSRIWSPTPTADGSSRIDHADVFATIAGVVADRWKVQAITYDPRFFELPANLLADQGFRVIEFPQSPERLIPADGLLFELVLEGGLAVLPDAALAEHSRNAAWRENERGRYLSKAKAGGHMDAIRAGSMATFELLQGDGPPTPPKKKGIH